LVKIVLVGYETLATVLEDHKFPFYARGGKGKTLLSPIERDNIRDLILQPMMELGIQLEPKEQFIERIWRTSLGLPNIVQDLCQVLVDLSFKNKKRTVNINDLNYAIHSSSALGNLTGAVLESGFPLAKLIAGISSLYTKSPNNEDFHIVDEISDLDKDLKDAPIFTIKSIIDRLSKYGYIYHDNEMNLALTHLELRLIIKKSNEGRTQWYWHFYHARKTVAERVLGIGLDNWIKGLVDAHINGPWREEYNKIGYFK